MRWKTNKPKPGSIKSMTKFAWLPTRIEDYTVWLEFYSATFVFNGKEWEEEAEWDYKENKHIFTSRRTLDYY